MRRQDKLKNIEEANKKLLREFDSDSYQETADNGYNRLSEYLQPLVDQGVLDRDIADEILNGRFEIIEKLPFLNNFLSFTLSASSKIMFSKILFCR